MVRRQLLFGAVLAVTLLGFDSHLIAQASDAAASSVRLSDRERDDVRGPVKTYSDFVGDEAVPVRYVEYAPDGRVLVWRIRHSSGWEVERIYSYDATGRLISIANGPANGTEEFHYDEQGKKSRVRTVPPRPADKGASMIDQLAFENAESGDSLTLGGTVTTSYNNDDQPSESLIRDARGELLATIVHNYKNGRLVSETLVWVRIEIFQELEGLPEQELRLAKAQMAQAISESGLDHIERSYAYDDKGRVHKRLFRAGETQDDTTITYNEHGDVAGTVLVEKCIDRIVHDSPIWKDCRSEVSYTYAYDGHGNWTEKTVDGEPSSGMHRKITYY